MTALAEALTAAQRQAIGALEKAYVAGAFDEDDDTAIFESLDRIGCTDVVEQKYLRACLDAIRAWGATAPQTNGAPPPVKRASDKQAQLIARLCDERGLVAPDLTAVTSPQASEIITSLQNGTYDPAKWEIPF